MILSAGHDTGTPGCDAMIVIEDDPMIRDGIVGLVNAAGFARQIHTFGTGQSAIEHLRNNPCDIVLVDLGLPDMTGIQVIEAIRSQGCTADIMVVTTSQNPQKIIASIQAGASGYFLKSNLQADLLPYLKALRNGGSPIDPVIARRLLDMLRQPAVSAVSASKPSPGSKPLSEQETRILTYVAKGFTSKEIAELLGLSPLTVSTHIRNIYRKLAVKNRTEAVFEASSQGLIPPTLSSPAIGQPSAAHDD